MFPTPRRALFTTSNMMDPIGGRGKRGPSRISCRWTGELTPNEEYVTTPPLPASSSPGMMDAMDMMEMSPLPHKAPYVPYVAQMEVQSPTPIVSPADDLMLEAPA